ncbi:hypothetical protein SALBM135S_05389 [Streptomyces alboniger]
MREGSILAQGHPRDVITAELLEEAFGLRARVVDDPVGDRPLIVPIGRTHVRLDERRTALRPVADAQLDWPACGMRW